MRRDGRGGVLVTASSVSLLVLSLLGKLSIHFNMGEGVSEERGEREDGAKRGEVKCALGDM